MKLLALGKYYCKSQESCVDCPLFGGVCINDKGKVDLPSFATLEDLKTLVSQLEKYNEK